MTRPAPRLVMVGFRKGLLAAARARDLPVVVVDEVPPGARALARGAVEQVLVTDRGGIPQLASALPRDRPLIVVATAERLVRTAARLAHALELAWPAPGCAETFTDKLAMKRAFRALAIPHARFAPGTPGHAAALARRAGFPVVVKPRESSSGVGQRVAGSARALARALSELAARYPRGLLVEEHVRAPEISVETFVSRGRVVYQSITEYIAYGEANLVSPALPPALAARVRALAARATLGFGLTHGLTHAEAFLTGSGPLLSEIAMRPPGGHLMDLIARACRIDSWKLYLDCLTGAPPARAPRARLVAANWIVYPPPGRVVEVSGADAVRALPGVVQVKVTAREGQLIEERSSLGQMKAVVTLAHADEAVVRASLARVRATLVIRTERARH